MRDTHVRSILLAFQPSTDTVVPITIGQQVHGLFLSLIKQCDADLNVRLHNGPSPRPYTLSSLLGGKRQGNHIILQHNVPYFLRLTLLDTGEIWKCLTTSLVGAQPLVGYLGSAEVRLTRIVSTLLPCTLNWAVSTDWQTLAMHPSQRSVTFHFISPTAFSLGQRHFELFPYPRHVWTSLLRTWNAYAPEHLHMDEKRVRQACADQGVKVTQGDLQTHVVHFPNFVQKGFTGTCTYSFKDEDVSELAILAAFAPYAGVGYKTTMGMGQVQTRLCEQTP